MLKLPLRPRGVLQAEIPSVIPIAGIYLSTKLQPPTPGPGMAGSNSNIQIQQGLVLEFKWLDVLWNPFDCRCQ